MQLTAKATIKHYKTTVTESNSISSVLPTSSKFVLFPVRISRWKVKCTPQTIQHWRLGCVTFLHCPDLLRLSNTPNNSIVLYK